jgi:predicted nucleic acid-binding protein
MDASNAVVDTDILIGLLRNNKDFVAFLSEIEEKNCALSTTSINAFELYYGAHKSRQSEQNLRATRKLLRRLILLPLEPKSAEIAGRIYAELEAKGHPIGLRDTLIGAIAVTKGFSLITGNAEHFRKIAGLKILTPSNPHE